jgi:hypothetical protein
MQENTCTSSSDTQLHAHFVIWQACIMLLQRSNDVFTVQIQTGKDKS